MLQTIEIKDENVGIECEQLTDTLYIEVPLITEHIASSDKEREVGWKYGFIALFVLIAGIIVGMYLNRKARDGPGKE